MLAWFLQAADLVDGKADIYTDLAQGQMDYILGGNPKGQRLGTEHEKSLSVWIPSMWYFEKYMYIFVFTALLLGLAQSTRRTRITAAARALILLQPVGGTTTTTLPQPMI